MTSGWELTITQAIGFALYVWVLSRVAVKPVVGLLDERKATIQRTFGELDQQQAELTQLKADYESRLARLSDESAKREAAAQIEGERIAAELLSDAQRRYQDLLLKAKGDVDREIAKARISFRDAIAQSATLAAEEIIRQRLDTTLQHSLIDRYIEDLRRVHV